MSKKALCWLRRDLRLHDHAALSMALKENAETYLVFVFDPHILTKLASKDDQRLNFIVDSLKVLEEKLNREYGCGIIIRHGDPVVEIPALARELGVEAVYANRDYEPYAKKRDESVGEEISLHLFKDHVIFEAPEVRKNDEGVYHVFTPYKNKWLEHLSQTEIPHFSCALERLSKKIDASSVLKNNWIKRLGFVERAPILKAGVPEAKARLKSFEKILEHYKRDRDFPALPGTSMLAVYLRHGNLSIRDALRAGRKAMSEGHQVWVSELVWREFYQMLLDVYPRLQQESFHRVYDQIKWVGREEHFDCWVNGQTGFPIVDAAMRCFKETGLMHNRLRMVVASFLCKTLLLDWRLGEEYFAQHLLDFDLAANSGGWQWSASVGCDAQPYFRIFNPYSQALKFDPDEIFIRQWCPEVGPSPIVDYAANRLKALEMYKKVKG